MRDGADILAGYDLTPNALAAADVSAQAKKFMVNMNAATSVITTKSPYMVRTSFTVLQLNEALGTWAYKNGVRKAYTLVSDFGPGHDGEAAFQKGFKDAGGEIIGSARYPVANLDFTAFLQRAKDANPDGIYIWVPGGPQPAAIGKAIAERGIDKSKVKVMGQGELTYEDALKSMGDAGLGLITAFHYDFNHQSAKNKAFVAAYNAEFKRNPDMFSVGGYDGMHVIYEALKKTGGKTDGEALIDAAKGMNWESPRGPMMIDPGDPRRHPDRLHPPRREGGRRSSSTSSSTRSRTSRTRGRRGCRSRAAADATAAGGGDRDDHVDVRRPVRRLRLRHAAVPAVGRAVGDARDDELRQSRALHLRDDRRLRHRDADEQRWAGRSWPPCRCRFSRRPRSASCSSARCSTGSTARPTSTSACSPSGWCSSRSRPRPTSTAPSSSR